MVLLVALVLQAQSLSMVGMQVGGRMFSFVHFESPVPSAIYMVELVQDMNSCTLRPISQQPTDW